MQAASVLLQVTILFCEAHICVYLDNNKIINNFQVSWPPEILSVRKSSIESGKGLDIEISCSVLGQPKPKVYII